MCVDNWLKLDDDKVSLVKEEDILKLSGGGKSVDVPSTLGNDDGCGVISPGDWHIAYILLYGPRRLEKLKKDITAS